MIEARQTSPADRSSHGTMAPDSAATQSRPHGGQPGELRHAQNRLASEGTTPFSPNWVVPLQREGKGRPVFVFPAWDKGPVAIAIEARVAAHVGRDHPFWAFQRDDAHVDRMRKHGVPALATEYVAHIMAIQGKGPFLLYGNCAGGYLAWETARQLLDLGEQIAGMLFYEVPVRADFTRVLPGNGPAHGEKLWRWTHYYRLQPLPIDLTCVMTETWYARGWWQPWQELVPGTVETVVIPNLAMSTQEFLARREAMIAQHVRDWIDRRSRASGAQMRPGRAPGLVLRVRDW